MKRGKDKDELVEYLKVYIPLLLRDAKLTEEVVEHLEDKHGIDEGSLMEILSDYDLLADQDELLLGIIAEQLYLKIPQAEKQLIPSNWFNELELKQMNGFVFVDHTTEDEISLPLVFEDAIDLGGGVIAVAVDNTMIAKMRKYRILNYNFDIQREAKVYNILGKVVRVMNIVYKNVKEMVGLIVGDELVKTSLAYNCAVDTSSNEQGEMYYNPKDKTLTINEGTRIDILDGAHRTLAFYEAYKINPNLQGKTIVHFSNYTPKQAQRYQAQLSKATPLSKNRVTELENKTNAVTLINRLKAEDVMKDKISTDGTSITNKGSIVTYSVILDAFNELWYPELRKEIDATLNTFVEYLEEYLTYYEELPQTKIKENLIFHRSLFAIHVLLAKKMKEKEIPFDKISSIIEKYSNEDKELLNEVKKSLNKTNNKNPKRYDELDKYVDELLKR